MAKPQRQAGALTADVLALNRLTAVQPRKRGRGIETAEPAEGRAKIDAGHVALVAVLSDCQFSGSSGRRFSGTSSHPGSAVN